ncbi:UDP-N-acetylmuramoyl-tripeptide--D-alanyl-D-alanine ligase [Domibacillus iocasae]|uniref:UDP-N-acetylmuramoylalanyl-D-glutamate--2, 6-diaminopimelate ligase n=1 Tax=Domibacillus iocasae TaxID=1714016 RepID=A0A1E7DQC3_9BACI|nr:UDP-N-acetylmuramoyl-tripeptide--D-alanyl-D-alanine ligase [Domibacillus iocasae]OES45287.1 UDP-N-acetylmuramoylalanyl-D-glutamate--2,6-diaminopimelate ligase [Domibacillus iocasae]
MEPILLKDIREVLEGELICGTEDWHIKNAIVYNRHPLEEPYTLIFLNKKESIYWGHFAQMAPCVVVTDKPIEDIRHLLNKTTVIRVKSMIQSYWTFIHYYRSLFKIPVTAITGTCGKTTVKEMIKHILSKSYTVQASESSKNEPRRSFHYLLGINRQTDMAVFETGLGNIGNIKHQCLIYQPTIGIITTIGAHHLDGCKTLEGYIQAKGEMIEGVAKNGTLILNADDENIKKLSLDSFEGRVVYFSVGSPSEFQAVHVSYAKNGMTFDLVYNEKTYPVFIPGYGEHQVYNALAAIAAVHQMGIGIDEALERLASFQNMERHLEVSAGMNGCTIIDDTWTINPTSVEAALKVVDELGKGKKTIVILGDINRLGDYEKEYHQKVGNMVAERTFDTLITIGEKAKEIGRQALQDGFKGNVHQFQTVEGILEIVKDKVDEHTLLLIKGPMKSRSMIALAQQLKML